MNGIIVIAACVILAMAVGLAIKDWHTRQVDKEMNRYKIKSLAH